MTKITNKFIIFKVRKSIFCQKMTKINTISQKLIIHKKWKVHFFDQPKTEMLSNNTFKFPFLPKDGLMKVRVLSKTKLKKWIFSYKLKKKLIPIKKTKWKYIKYIFHSFAQAWIFFRSNKNKKKTIFFDNNRKQ